MLLLKENATVTICHTRTKELPEICRQAEILVAAAGKAGMVEESWVSDGAVVIDVGINVDETENSAVMWIRHPWRAGTFSLHQCREA